MTVFAIICLIVILLSIQHLLNWIWRVVKHDDVGIAFVATLFVFCITCLCIKYIVLWMYPLLA